MREEALELMLQVLRAMETWVHTLSQEEADLAQPPLKKCPLPPAGLCISLKRGALSVLRKPNAPSARKDVASAFTLMKLCSSNCGSVNRRHKDAPSCVNGSRWNIAWLTLNDGKADVHAIAASAKISSIYAAALSFTIYTF